MAAGLTEHATKAKHSHHGPLVDDTGTAFRVWAPEHKRIDVVLVDSNGNEQRKEPLSRDSEGYFSGHVADVTDGALYFYRIDGDSKNYPDPASNFQPQGVHGPSQVIDHRSFAWSDQNWPGVRMRGQVIYEMHIGAFTREGNWRAAADKLPHLRDVGITLLQVMPVAAFPGEFGWGYDGVYWFAPTQLYGTPDEMRAFVDRAHALGIGVVLDCVYNHLGPSGNYATKFSQAYFSEKHHTEWGEAINFDGPNSGPVREFVADNAAYWVRHFHLDGLRLDAIQTIVDDSEEHIVAQLTRTARNVAGNRSIVIYSEDEWNRGRQVLPTIQGGWGTDGILNDDFHHSSRVAATGHAEAYYSDYAGTPQELISAIRHGHLYQGQYNARQGKIRGRPSQNVAAEKFVHFLQNHDQVANSPCCSRTHALTTPGRHRALTALLLLGPQTPMLFMGQEFSASNSFCYFADHEPELAKLVSKGRREFMSQFPRLESFKEEYELPEPAEETTFLTCKLNWDEVEQNAKVVRLHRDLIRLRKEDPTISRQDRSAIEGSVIGPEAFLLRWFGHDNDDRLAFFNLGRDIDWYPIADPMLAPPPGRRWTRLWSSDEPFYGGPGTPSFDNENWRVPGHAALVFRADSI
jgi:maltooligosyltrehalose trehalohydrolase